MYKIVVAEFLAENIKRFVIEAPNLAAKRKAGQFVIIRLNEGGERIPLTIADSETANGTITIIVIVPKAVSESAIVSGILSPPSFNLIITNCPAFLLAAIFGASITKRFIFSAKNSATTILYI